MSDCVITQPIAEAGIELLRRAGLTVFCAPSPQLDAYRLALQDARAVITRSAGFSAEAMAAAPRLEVIGSHGTGTNTIDIEAARARGITVLNTPGTNAPSVAELVFALLLACARRLPAADAAVRIGDDGFRTRETGIEISGRTLGLIGFGHIARHVARLGGAFGMTVLGWSRHASPEEMQAAGITPARCLDSLLEQSDAVSLHAMASGEPLLDAVRMQRLKPGAILINTARGSLIDEAALAQALINGHLAAAGLDVYAHEPLSLASPLHKAPNLVLSPHIGGSTHEALERTGIEVARRVLQALGLVIPEGSGPTG